MPLGQTFDVDKKNNEKKNGEHFSTFPAHDIY